MCKLLSFLRSMVSLRRVCLRNMTAGLVNVVGNVLLVVIAMIGSFVVVLVILMIISVSISLSLNILLIISSLAQLLAILLVIIILIQHLRLFADGTAIDATIVLVSSIVLTWAVLGWTKVVNWVGWCINSEDPFDEFDGLLAPHKSTVDMINCEILNFTCW